MTTLPLFSNSLSHLCTMAREMVIVKVVKKYKNVSRQKLIKTTTGAGFVPDQQQVQSEFCLETNTRQDCFETTERSACSMSRCSPEQATLSSPAENSDSMISLGADKLSQKRTFAIHDKFHCHLYPTSSLMIHVEPSNMVNFVCKNKNGHPCSEESRSDRKVISICTWRP